MAEVLRISPTHEAAFSSGGLRRNTSHPSLFLDPSSTPPCSGPESFARSLPSCSSTPASSLSLKDQFCSQEEEEARFASHFDESEEEWSENEDPTPSNSPPKSSSPATVTTHSHSRTSKHHPKQLHSAGDDLALENKPSRHVDYLTHDWREEEIWSSWRHVVGKRRTIDNWERLENASWRTWAKSRGRLPTVSAATLNWMKDHDVTWLYGPLQSAQIHPRGVASPSATIRLTRADSFIARKSILKKRSVSEVMLQRSLSNSTLVKQAVDSIVSQGPLTARSQALIGAYHERETAEAGRRSYPTPIQTPTRSLDSSSSSSGIDTPSERRHIHFSEKVEQCIAINKDADYGPDEEEEEDFEAAHGSDEESDDGILMMRSEKGKERRLSTSQRATPRTSFSVDPSQRTIAMLPATKLRGDTPEPPDALFSKPGLWQAQATLNKSSSQETLKPTRPSSNFLIDNGDENRGRREPTSPSSSPGEDALESWSDQGAPAVAARTIIDEDAEMESRGLRRTASGMYMPYDENEGGFGSGGLFGRVIDSVNTARDIAHVIWNVGWRR